jgi:hypothetical protein
MQQKKKLTIVWETGDDQEVCARIVERGRFTLLETGEDWNEIRNTLKELVADYIENEGSNDPIWSKLNAYSDIEYLEAYDLTTIFDLYPVINVNALARSIDMNPSLLRQYASGSKHVTASVAQRIEVALRSIGKRLSTVNVSENLVHV